MRHCKSTEKTGVCVSFWFAFMVICLVLALCLFLRMCVYFDIAKGHDGCVFLVLLMWIVIILLVLTSVTKRRNRGWK